MKNKLISNPSKEDAETLFSEFECTPNDKIALTVEDFYDAIQNENTAVVIEKKALGENRIKVALDGIVESFLNFVPDFNPFEADKMVCLVSIGEDFDIKELNHLSGFFNNYPKSSHIVWGITQQKNVRNKEVDVRLLLTYNH